MPLTRRIGVCPPYGTSDRRTHRLRFHLLPATPLKTSWQPRDESIPAGVVTPTLTTYVVRIYKNNTECCLKRQHSATPLSLSAPEPTMSHVFHRMPNKPLPIAVAGSLASDVLTAAFRPTP